LKAAPVKEFLAGLEAVSPVLPEAAGVRLVRSVDRPAVIRWMEAAVSKREVYAVAVVCGLLAGLRMREAARLLMRGGAEAFSVSLSGEVRWKEACSTKSNMRGGRLLADRIAKVTEAVAAGLRRMELPWLATEQEATRLVRETAAKLRDMGLSGDVRAFRRSLARGVRECFVTQGATEEEAVSWVRRTLGHRPGSMTTFRYLGTAVSDLGARRMEDAWEACQAIAT